MSLNSLPLLEDELFELPDGWAVAVAFTATVAVAFASVVAVGLAASGVVAEELGEFDVEPDRFAVDPEDTPEALVGVAAVEPPPHALRSNVNVKIASILNILIDFLFLPVEIGLA